MTTTVATRPLEDASGFWLVHPYWGIEDRPLIDANGDEIFVGVKLIAGEKFNRVQMDRITVDGVETFNPGPAGYWSSYLFSTKIDPTCASDEGESCMCQAGYRPVSYALGEICERCWLEGAGTSYRDTIRGVGTAGCPHN